MDSKILRKLTRLESIIGEMKSVLIAFSGGTDSTFLAFICNRILGQKSLAVMVCSEFVPRFEIRESETIAGILGIRYKLLKTSALSDKRLVVNPRERCYFCKKKIMNQLCEIARKNKLENVVEGSNRDDFNTLRPGKKALRELGIRSPLFEAGLNKQEIRMLSRRFKLPNWDKPSASCLATRFSYGTRLNKIDLGRVADCEHILRKYIKTQLRLRVHGDIVRVEVEKNKRRLLLDVLENPEVLKKFNTLKYKYLCVDVRGFCSGSMD